MLARKALVAALVTAMAGAGMAGEPTKKTGAPWPKGQYSTLNALPDWGGVWVLVRAAPPAPGEPARERPVLKGEYKTHYDNWLREAKANDGMARKAVSNCMPPGMPGMMGTGQYPIEFLFTPGRVSTHHEAWMQLRAIYTDGRGHPDDWDGGIFGHSIGRWERDTLVVETIGIKTITEISAGIRHSDKLRIVERLHLSPKDPDILLDEMTLEDPEALERPFHQTFTYKRQRDWNLMEFVCAEDDRNPVDESGHTQFETR